MTLVLIGKGLVLEASTTKIEDKQVPGIYIYIYMLQERVYTVDPKTLRGNERQTSFSLQENISELVFYQ